MLVFNGSAEDFAHTLRFCDSKDSKALEYVTWEGEGIPTMRSTQQRNVQQMPKNSRSWLRDSGWTFYIPESVTFSLYEMEEVQS